MKRDILFSAAFHIVVVFATLITSPFDVRSRSPFDEVIRVQLTAGPMTAAEITPPEPVAIPEAMPDESMDIPISDPSTVEEPVAIDKPEEEPEPKDEPEPERQATPPQTSSSESAGSGDEENAGEIEEAGGAGSPFTGATVDNASFDYPYWFTQAFYKIRSNWRNPVAYDGVLICTVYFQVIKSGRVIELRVEESSGVDAFDQACLAAIERSKPFPPLPSEFADEIIGLTVPFKYQPRGY